MQEKQRSTDLVPHEQLRQERQRRGWSRAYIADQIGVADPKTIGRWERGIASPSAYFLQKLCALFQMPAEELGLWQRECQPVLSNPGLHYLRSDNLHAFSEIVLIDPALPQVLPGGLVGRASLLEQLKQRLCVESGSAVAALSGLPGVGKTALALELARDNAIQEHFADGILWVRLGRQPDVVNELRRLGQLLEVDASDLPSAASSGDWAWALHTRISNRRMLLIIDDAWNCNEALAFQIGGPNCAYLLTTRLPSVALYFANSQACPVQPLSADASLEVLARFVPEMVTHEASSMRELVGLAGGLPLALQLWGRYLQTEAYSGQPRRGRAALERLLREPAARLQLTLPGALLERQAGHAGALVSLQSALEPGYRQLDLAARRALCVLTTLVTASEIFSEEAALALNGVTLEVLDSLLDAGLLASAGLGDYTLHKTIADFALCQADKSRTDPACFNAKKSIDVLEHTRDSLAFWQESVNRPNYPRETILPAFIYEAEGERVTQ